ncbi:unnamed protein product [Calypogeia fissa]
MENVPSQATGGVMVMAGHQCSYLAGRAYVRVPSYPVPPRGPPSDELPPCGAASPCGPRVYPVCTPYPVCWPPSTVVLPTSVACRLPVAHLAPPTVGSHLVGLWGCLGRHAAPLAHTSVQIPSAAVRLHLVGRVCPTLGFG